MRRLLLPALALVLTGCAAATPVSAPTEPETSTVPTGIAGAGPGQTVLDVSRSGGMCAGPCRHPHLTVKADGSWTVTIEGGEEAPASQQGVLTPAQREALEQALEDTGLRDAPRAERFCSSWVDGFDTEVRWRPGPDSVERASSCDFDFGESDPLLRFAAGLVEA